MPINVACDCGHKFRVASEHAGKLTRCKRCHEPVRIPRPKVKRRSQTRQAKQPVTTTKASRKRPRQPQRSASKSSLAKALPNEKIRQGLFWTSGAVVLACAIALGSDRVVLGLPAAVYYLAATIAGLGLGCLLEEDYPIPGLIAGPIMAIGVVATMSYLDLRTEGRMPRGLTLVGIAGGGLPGYLIFLLGKKIQDLNARR